MALRALHSEYDKPALLTGLGYLSRGGTAADPSKGNYAQKAAGGRYNQEAQARPYRAAFDCWSAVARREHWFDGIYWWAWNAGLRDTLNGDYAAEEAGRARALRPAPGPRVPAAAALSARMSRSSWKFAAAVR